MYIILVYDISMEDIGPRILRNVFKICKKYLQHVQCSVFEGELSPSQLANLKAELQRWLRVPTCEFKSRVAALAARRSGFCDYLSMPPRKMDQTGYSRERNPFCHTILITFCRCQVLYFSRFSDSNQNVSFFAQFAFF